MRVLGSTFTDILGFGDQLFTVIVLVVCAGITSHMCFGFGTKKAKETFVALILVLIVGTQFFHLITAVTYIPISKNYSFDVSQTLPILTFRVSNCRDNHIDIYREISTERIAWKV